MPRFTNINVLIIQTLLLAFIHTFSFKVIIGGGKISKGYTNFDLYEIRYFVIFSV